ncbi:hypothetical protein JCM10213_004181 [Rhodosporidiobolus nylandii]
MSLPACSQPDDDYTLPFQLPGLVPRAPQHPTPPRTVSSSPSPPNQSLSRSKSLTSTFLGVYIPRRPPIQRRNTHSDMLTRRTAPTPHLASPPVESASTAEMLQGPGTSLKIVLKRKGGAAGGDKTSQASLPTPSASPPVLTLDDTPPPTPSGGSRSASPAPAPAAGAAPTRSRAPTLVPALPTAAKKQRKNGNDGLNRVCHHHKSQTDRPRMTCINAPDCRTVWCNVCVEKYYLSCTPLGQFKDSGDFICPVCQNACLCAGCKRKRRGFGRDGRPLASAYASTSAPTTGGLGQDEDAYEPPRAVKRKTGRPPKDKGEKKEGKRDRKGKGRLEVARAEAAALGMVVHGPDRENGSLGGGSSSEDEGSMQRMLVEVDEVDEQVPVEDAEVPLPPPLPAEGPAAVPVEGVLPAPPKKKKDKRRGKKDKSRRRSSLAVAYESPYPTAAADVVDGTLPPHPSYPAGASAAAPTPKRRRTSSNRPRSRPSLPATADPYSLAGDSAFNYGHPTASLSAWGGDSPATSRPKRNKRPSSAFDDYAVDYASAPSPMFNERVGPGGSRSKRPNAPGGQYADAAFPAYPTREEIQAAQTKRRRFRTSGISSASSCDGMSSFGEEESDDEDVAMAAGREEEPLPVLAGLERNLGLAPPEEGEEEEGEGGVSFGEMFGVELLLPSAQPADDEGEKKPRVVKWIEGPERRKRRAEAAAARAAKVKEASDVSGDGEKVKEEQDVDEEKPAPSPPADAAPAVMAMHPEGSNAGDPLRPFGSPLLQRRPSLAASEPSSILTAVRAPSPPPSYESQFPPGSSRPAPSRPSSVDTPPSASSSASPAPPPSSAPRSASELTSRSEADAKLAFALLDAVRAAAGSRPSPSSTAAPSGEAASAPPSEPNYSAALSAALAVPLSQPSSPSKPSPVPTSAPAVPPPRPSPSNPDLQITPIDPLEAQRLEAERRRASLAAAAQVDAGKAFKPLAKGRAESQFFVEAPGGSDDELDLDAEDDVGPSVSLRGREETPATAVALSAGGGAAALEFDFDSFVAESPLLVEDLWTPSSVADTSLSLCTSASAVTAASTVLGGGGAADAVEAEPDYPFLSPLPPTTSCSAAPLSGAIPSASASCGEKAAAGALDVFDVDMEMDLVGLGEVMGWMEESSSQEVHEVEMRGVEAF